jgi:hypothetical protein
VINVEGETRILPVGMWIFNKVGGDKVIMSKQNDPARLFTTIFS